MTTLDAAILGIVKVLGSLSLICVLLALLCWYLWEIYTMVVGVPVLREAMRDYHKKKASERASHKALLQHLDKSAR